MSRVCRARQGCDCVIPVQETAAVPRGLSNGWHSPLPAQAGPGKPLSTGLGRGSPPWPPPLAACGRDSALARAESTVSGESVYFDAGALKTP